MQNMSFSRIEMNQNVIFRKRKNFQKLTYRKNFDSKSNALYFFSNQNLTRCKILNQTLTCCIIFILKSNMLYSFIFKICFSNCQNVTSPY